MKSNKKLVYSKKLFKKKEVLIEKNKFKFPKLWKLEETPKEFVLTFQDTKFKKLIK